MVMPGDNTDMSVQLIQPIAMEEELKFAIREGGRTVGAGRVTKIIQFDGQNLIKEDPGLRQKSRVFFLPRGGGRLDGMQLLIVPFSL